MYGGKTSTLSNVKIQYFSSLNDFWGKNPSINVVNKIILAACLVVHGGIKQMPKMPFRAPHVVQEYVGYNVYLVFLWIEVAPEYFNLIPSRGVFKILDIHIKSAKWVWYEKYNHTLDTSCLRAVIHCCSQSPVSDVAFSVNAKTLYPSKINLFLSPVSAHLFFLLFFYLLYNILRLFMSPFLLLNVLF